MSATAKIPERMCLGCRQMYRRDQLIRLVRTPAGEICLDESQKMPGRGAYLCRNSSCLKRIKKGRSLEKALRSKCAEEIFQQLEQQILESEGTNASNGAS